MKRIAIAAICAATTLATGSTALALQGSIEHEVYNYTFYSDASHTTVVGQGRTRCQAGWDYSGTYYIRSGTNSPYYDQELAGICIDGVLWPY